jgi:hypothetical protein
MTQKERILEMLEDGPLSTVQMAETLHIRRTVVTSTLVKLQKTGEVVSLARTWPRLYRATGSPGDKFCEPDDLFNVKPSLTKCSYCKKAITKRTREVERRETGADNEIQLWGWCKPCFKKQRLSRQKGRSEDLADHVSRLPVATFPLKKGLQHYGR